MVLSDMQVEYLPSNTAVKYSRVYRFLFENNRNCWQINITGFIIVSKIIGINNFIKIKYLKNQ